MIKLTDEQIAAYLANPGHCPRPTCNSAAIRQKTCNVKPRYHCLNCGLEWLDIFTLSGIEIDQGTTAANEKEMTRRKAPPCQS